jgi:Phage virion morphogenesis family
MPGYVEVRGLERAQRMIEGLGRRAARPKRFLTGASQVLRTGFRKQLAADGSYYGGGWQPLAAATLERKTRQGYPAEIMMQTGSLESRIRSAEARIRPEGLSIGVTDRIAAFHQAGTGSMPRRQLIGATRREVEQIGRLGDAWIAGRR